LINNPSSYKLLPNMQGSHHKNVRGKKRDKERNKEGEMREKSLVQIFETRFFVLDAIFDISLFSSSLSTSLSFSLSLSLSLSLFLPLFHLAHFKHFPIDTSLSTQQLSIPKTLYKNFTFCVNCARRYVCECTILLIVQIKVCTIFIIKQP
jgi:hypothetical protein